MQINLPQLKKKKKIGEATKGVFMQGPDSTAVENMVPSYSVAVKATRGKQRDFKVARRRLLHTSSILPASAELV